MLVALTETEAKDLLKSIHYRHKRASTIFVLSFRMLVGTPRSEKPVLADAIPDRIVHDSYVVEIHSDPVRISPCGNTVLINKQQVENIKLSKNS